MPGGDGGNLCVAIHITKSFPSTIIIKLWRFILAYIYCIVIMANRQWNVVNSHIVKCILHSCGRLLHPSDSYTHIAQRTSYNHRTLSS